MTLKDAAEYAPPPETDLIDIYVDPDLIIVSKPSGLLSVPGRGPEKAVCAQSIAQARHGSALIVHRLDMDTSGLLVMARHKEAQAHLSRQFERRQVAKTYEALVEGRLTPIEGEIDLPIAKYSLQRPLRHISRDGQTAVTLWKVLNHRETCTHVQLTPLTGRSHQLRLHMKEQGHPILGDVFYGQAALAPRLMLHATQLRINHPTSDKKVTFNAPSGF